MGPLHLFPKVQDNTYHTYHTPRAIKPPSEEGWRARWAQTILRGVGRFVSRGRAECFPRAFGTSQNVCRSTACPAAPTVGGDLPHSLCVLEAAGGAFRCQEDFRLCSVVGAFFFLVVMTSLVFFFFYYYFFFFYFQKLPVKLGNSQQGTFRAVLENTEAKKCQG